LNYNFFTLLCGSGLGGGTTILYSHAKRNLTLEDVIGMVYLEQGHQTPLFVKISQRGSHILKQSSQVNTPTEYIASICSLSTDE
jgi:hypothetical protein